MSISTNDRVYWTNPNPSPYCPFCGGVLPGRAVWQAWPRPCLCATGYRPAFIPAVTITRSTSAPVVVAEEQTERAAWECPRCGAMNAPHIDQCPCKKKKGKNSE